MLEWHSDGSFSRHNHLSHNAPLILLFILTHRLGHYSQFEPSFQTNMQKQEPELWQGGCGCRVQASAKLPLGWTTCLSMQITPNQKVQNWRAACWVPRFNCEVNTAPCCPANMERMWEASCNFLQTEECFSNFSCHAAWKYLFLYLFLSLTNNSYN